MCCAGKYILTATSNGRAAVPLATLVPVEFFKERHILGTNENHWPDRQIMNE